MDDLEEMVAILQDTIKALEKELKETYEELKASDLENNELKEEIKSSKDVLSLGWGLWKMDLSHE